MVTNLDRSESGLGERNPLVEATYIAANLVERRCVMTIED